MTKKSTNKRYILVVLVENKSGVLNRVASLFRRRRFNIESLTVGHTEKKDISRMTIVMNGDSAKMEQVKKQLYKIIEVLKIIELDEKEAIVRELALIKVHATKANRPEIMQIVDIYEAKIADVSLDALTIEICTKPATLDSFITLMHNFGIKELVRTGMGAMQRS